MTPIAPSVSVFIVCTCLLRLQPLQHITLRRSPPHDVIIGGGGDGHVVGGGGHHHSSPAAVMVDSPALASGSAKVRAGWLVRRPCDCGLGLSPGLGHLLLGLVIQKDVEDEDKHACENKPGQKEVEIQYLAE